MVRSVLAVAAFAAFASSSLAGTMYGFSNISANNVSNAITGETQLRVEVDAAGPGQVAFIFSNSGPAAMSITDVYFDDGTLLGIATIINGGSGVSFSQGASPGNLPGGNTISPAFVTTAGFSADSNPPAQPNGVNPGETLTIIFNLLAGKTLADTLAALSTPGGDLRIGIHVQGFANGGSESFLHQVPAPSTALPLALAGLACLTGSRRRPRQH